MLQLTIYNCDVGAALFTFSKYIINHLEENLTIKSRSDIPCTNRVILHIQVSDRLLFYKMYGFLAKKIENEVFNSIKMLLEKKFDTWKKSNDLVLPVETVENRLEVVNLGKIDKDS